MREADIRPLDLFRAYLDRVRVDARRLLESKAEFVEVACPGCAAEDATPAFDTDGYRWNECRACQSLFVSPRPSPEALRRFYTDSEAVRFWTGSFFKETAEARRERMFRPRARDVATLLEGTGRRGDAVLVDIGSGYGLFLEEVARLGVCRTVVGIEPAGELAEVCRGKGFPVIEAFVETLPAGAPRADLVTAYEVLEHTFDPLAFLRSTATLLRPGGLLLFTTLVASGFDVQVLWQHAKGASPPQHLNLPSLEGLRRLVARTGLALVELTTPGQLDVDIVRNTMAENPALVVPRFVRQLLDAGPACERDFQALLQRYGLSSHARVVARRDEDGAGV
jgi:SAM-dependent methyltransferase